MTLTVVVGASGSGKTTFLEDVHKQHRCIYVRQYHMARPYIVVNRIPNFDPSTLPFWEVYEKEGKADSIQVGGTMAGSFTAGFSGGQRKLLLFELIYQRTVHQEDLLICLDEPFSGVTDDFVPFIVERLTAMRQKHNILLVTNDHVKTLTQLADNQLTVSAIDRSHVKINAREAVPRAKAMLALSLGNEYEFAANNADLKFFMDVEILSNGDLLGIVIFTVFSFGLFLATFWDSDPDSAALVLVAGGIIAFFCVNPYLLSLVEWRNAMVEEAEALVHSSKGLNKMLKTALTVLIIACISVVEFGCVVAVIDGLTDVKIWVAMLFDSFSLTFTLICLGLYSRLPFQAAQILGSLPFLLMIFLSTTFSPGAGVPGLKELRYVYARFYFWCMVPGVEDQMEGCPDPDLNMLYLILSAMVGTVIFLVIITIGKLRKTRQRAMEETKRASLVDADFRQLQIEMYGRRVLRRLKGGISGSLHSTDGSDDEQSKAGDGDTGVEVPVPSEDNNV